jgi:hypothetical protein
VTTAAGATGGIYERFSETWGVLKNVTFSALETHEFPSTGDYLRVLGSTLSVTSSFRNASKGFKAWWFDEVRSTTGILQQSDAAGFEALMMSLGVVSSDLAEVYHADEIKRFQQERTREYIKEMRKIFLFYSRNYDISNEESRSELISRMAAILRSIPSESKKAELMASVWNTAIDMSKEDKQYFDGIKNQVRGEIEQGILGAAANTKLGVGD